jgi:protein-disulfide isomerase
MASAIRRTMTLRAALPAAVAGLVVLAAAPPGHSAAEIAARVDGDPILLRDVDAPSRSKIDRLHAELARVAQSAVDDLIDGRLARLPGAAPDPTPLPVTEEAVRDFRAAHPRDFDGEHGPGAAGAPEVDRAAIRFRLEREVRIAAEAAGRRARRAGHAIETTLPPAAQLAEALAPGRTVARLDGGAVPAKEMERAAALRLYRLRGEIFRERSRNLGAAIEARLLEREAARRGTTEAALVAAQPTAVSEAEIDAFIAGERAAGRPVPSRERARPYLEFQKAHARRAELVDALRRRAAIEVLLREPAVPHLEVGEDGAAAALGPADGPRVVAFTNYRCRVCRATHAELDRLRAANPKVRIVLRDFIAVYDPAALEAARLARCAAKLGGLAEVRAALLERKPPRFGWPWFRAEERKALSRAAGIDPHGLESCLAAPEIDAAISADTSAALRLGFDEAPAFVVAGVPLSGMQSAGGLARALARGTELSP